MVGSTSNTQPVTSLTEKECNYLESKIFDGTKDTVMSRDSDILHYLEFAPQEVITFLTHVSNELFGSYLSVADSRQDTGYKGLIHKIRLANLDLAMNDFNTDNIIKWLNNAPPRITKYIDSVFIEDIKTDSKEFSNAARKLAYAISNFMEVYRKDNIDSEIKANVANALFSRFSSDLTASEKFEELEQVLAKLDN